jgi:hypothetical protein
MKKSAGLLAALTFKLNVLLQDFNNRAVAFLADLDNLSFFIFFPKRFSLIFFYLFSKNL